MLEVKIRIKRKRLNVTRFNTQWIQIKYKAYICHTYNINLSNLIYLKFNVLILILKV